MAAKTKRSKSRKKKLESDVLSQVKRHLEREEYKQALKDARVCFRQSPSLEHRQFLEIAYIGRAQQLKKQNNLDACKNILQELLKLKPQEPSVHAGLAGVLLWAGMLDQMPGGQEAIESSLGNEWKTKLADQAVLLPETTPSKEFELRQGAQLVRDCMQAMYEKNDLLADERIRSIKREGPFADWKTFLRGLAAYYAKDRASMNANWSRLDSKRVAATIAKPLMVLANESKFNSGDLRLADKIRSIEAAANCSGLLTFIQKLRQQCEQQDFRSAKKTFQTIHGILRTSEPVLADLLVSWYRDLLIAQGHQGDLVQLSRSVRAPSMDPNWNRAKALLEEGYEDARVEKTIPLWEAYANDLNHCQVLNDSERRISQTLVHSHIGKLAADEVECWNNCRCGFDHAEEVLMFSRVAQNHLEKSLELVPDHMPAFQTLLRLYAETNRLHDAEELSIRAIKQMPNLVPALEFMVSRSLKNGDPEQAIQYALQIQRAKPLAKASTNLLISTHISASRYWALQGDFDRARASLDHAKTLVPGAPPSDILCRQAVLEFKAGDALTARQRLEQALESLSEPTPVWLMMMVESNRIELAEAELYEKRWTDALRKRCHGSTAGQMCRYIWTTADNKYSIVSSVKRTITQLSVDQKNYLTNYVKRCSRVKWTIDDLRYVCCYLMSVGEVKILGIFAKRGAKLFPDSPAFYCFQVMAEICRGPFRFRSRYVNKSLRLALDNEKNAQGAIDQDLLEQIRIVAPLLDSLSLGNWHKSERGSQTPSRDDLDEIRDSINEIIEESGLTAEEIVDQLEECAVFGNKP